MRDCGFEDLEVYRKLYQLYLEVCDLTRQWPAEERFWEPGQEFIKQLTVGTG